MVLQCPLLLRVGVCCWKDWCSDQLDRVLRTRVVDLLLLVGVTESGLVDIARRCVANRCKIYTVAADRAGDFEVLITRFVIHPDRKFSFYGNTTTKRGLLCAKVVLPGGKCIAVCGTRLERNGNGNGSGPTGNGGSNLVAKSQLKCALKYLESTGSSTVSLLLCNGNIGNIGNVGSGTATTGWTETVENGNGIWSRGLKTLGIDRETHFGSGCGLQRVDQLWGVLALQ